VSVAPSNAFQALGIVYVHSHNFSTLSCEFLCLGSTHISGKHTSHETIVGVIKNGPDQTTTLGPGYTYHIPPETGFLIPSFIANYLAAFQ